MAILQNSLDLSRCPHCSVDRPNFQAITQVQTNDANGQRQRLWRLFFCARCGGVVVAGAPGDNHEISELFPAAPTVDSSIPERARTYLDQACNSLHAPAGAVMLAASSVDAMLKAKGYKQGNLYSRIDQAAKEHLITPDMAKWAHQVRLDANEQRHSDEAAPLPSREDASHTLEFAQALAQFMFVLPARIERGLTSAS